MTTYYVDGVNGNDTNAGTSEGSGNAWATVDKAMNTVAAGDHVYIKGNGTYSETPVIDTAGTSAAIILFEGYTTTPGDKGKATISGTTNCMTATNAGAVYYRFENLIFTGASAANVDLTNPDNIIFYNCEFNNAGTYGLILDRKCGAINCIFSGNVTDILIDFYGIVAGCTFLNGSSTGAQGDYSTASIIYKCVYSGEAGYIQNAQCILACTIDGQGQSSSANGVVKSTRDFAIDNLLHDVGYGFRPASTSHADFASAYNLFSSVTNNYWDGAADEDLNLNIGGHDVSAAANFTNEAGGDLTLGATSNAIDAGLLPGGIT